MYQEMEVERTNKARFRALNREKRAAKLPAAKEAGFEVWNRVVAQLHEHGAHEKLTRPQPQDIVLARDLVPVGCKTPLQQYRLQRLEEIIREKPGCPSGFGTILPRSSRLERTPAPPRGNETIKH